jgi:predicted outer membrane repeat protein
MSPLLFFLGASLPLPPVSFDPLLSASVLSSSLVLSQYTYDRKTSTEPGGGLSFKQAHLEVRDCLFRSCSAPSGGAAYLSSAVLNVVILGSFFLYNSASGSGGGIFCRSDSGTLSISSTLFDGNLAQFDSHFSITFEALNVQSCSFRYAGSNGSGGNYSGSVDCDSTTFNDCQFFRNSRPFALLDSGTVDISYCCFGGGTEGDCFLYFEDGQEGDTTIYSSCFNSSQEDAFQMQDNRTVQLNSVTFGVCGECEFGVTPPPTATASVRLNSPEVIVMIAGVGSAIVLGALGAVWLRYKCQKVVPVDVPEGGIEAAPAPPSPERARSPSSRSGNRSRDPTLHQPLGPLLEGESQPMHFT